MELTIRLSASLRREIIDIFKNTLISSKVFFEGVYSGLIEKVVMASGLSNKNAGSKEYEFFSVHDLSPF